MKVWIRNARTDVEYLVLVLLILLLLFVFQEWDLQYLIEYYDVSSFFPLLSNLPSRTLVGLTFL